MIVVHLALAAKHAIEQEACIRRLRETGGPLFGYEAENSDQVIEVAGGPGPKAVHGRYYYKPDREAMQKMIDAEHCATGGRRYFLGEWHSHPLGLARLSRRDRRSVAETAKDDLVNLEQPLALIQATLPWGRRVRPGQLRAWAWDGKEPQEAEIKICADSG